MAKKHRQNPEKPKEFHATPFSALKGIALPETPRQKVEKPAVPAPADSPVDELEAFLLAVSDVKPFRPKSLQTPEKDVLQKSATKKVPVPSAVDEQASQLFIQEINRLKLDSKFADSVPDEGEIQSISNNRLRQVKRGIVSVEYQLDLHGLTREEALLALPRFLLTARQKGQKAVLIITGKGNHSVEEPVLNQAVASWLREAGRELIVEYAPAPREMGGSGALVVFLRAAQPPLKKS
ncbi:MAG: DNA mismatch repair protein MutS [Geobacter sp.]|nr:DNA mismatch repair protein MutS [Geobacter sp.]